MPRGSTSERPLVNDRILREELAKLELQGIDRQAATDALAVVLPPTSARRAPEYRELAADEIERLKRIVRAHGLELINDGASYRCKRGRDFMIWTLEASPLVPETRGGGEGYALQEMVRRFCEPES